MALISSTRQVPHRLRRGEGGYILLTLMLVCALMAIAATVVITDISFEIKRDREEEMVHRGVQYTRAIKAYYKKLGRYPTKLEDLDNTNNLRYLRKHYKDPENCKNGKCQDFKLLHFGDPGLSLGSNFGGGQIPGMTSAGSPGGLNGPGASNPSFSGGSSFGGSSGGSSFGSNSSFGGSGSGSGFGNSGVNSQGVFAQTGAGGSSNSSFGAGSNNSGAPNAPGANPTSGDASQSGSGSQDSSSSQSGAGNSNGSSSPTGLGGQTFGGGPIVGVASLCKDKTIRIYNKKSKYNEWQFIYDPTADRGGLITTPYQPLQTLGGGGIPGAQPAGGNGTGSAFGNSGTGSAFGNSGSGGSFGNSGSSSFGSGSGFGNNSNGPASPPANPPQQQ